MLRLTAQTCGLLDPAGRDHEHFRRPRARAALERHVLKLIERPNVTERALAELRELFDVYLDLLRDFKPQLRRRRLHAPCLLADVIARIRQDGRAERDQLAVRL